MALPAGPPGIPVLGPYVLYERIYEMRHSQVWKGYHRDSLPPGTQEAPPLAIKIRDTGNAQGNEGQRIVHEEMMREIQIHAQLQHPNIVRLQDTIVPQTINGVSSGFVAMVMPFARGGCLHRFMRQTMERNFSAEEAVHAFGKIGEAIEYLHANKVIHRDLKPGNILIPHWEVRNGHYMVEPAVSDLGFSKRCDDTTHNPNSGPVSIHAGAVGTLPFMSKEMLNKNLTQEATFADDCWSAGVTLYNMQTGGFPGDTWVACISEQGILDEHITLNLHGTTREITLGLLRKEPRLRMTASDAVSVCYRHKHHLHATPSDSTGEMPQYPVPAVPEPSRPATIRMPSMSFADASSFVQLLSEWAPARNPAAAVVGVAAFAAVVGAVVVAARARRHAQSARSQIVSTNLRTIATPSRSRPVRSVAPRMSPAGQAAHARAFRSIARLSQRAASSGGGFAQAIGGGWQVIKGKNCYPSHNRSAVWLRGSHEESKAMRRGRMTVEAAKRLCVEKGAKAFTMSEHGRVWFLLEVYPDKGKTGTKYDLYMAPAR